MENKPVKNLFAYFPQQFRKDILIAKEEAISYRSKFIKPEHLLTAMIVINDERKLGLFEEYGIDANELKNEIIISHKMGKRDYSKPIPLYGSRDINFTKNAARAMHNSYENMVADSSKNVEPKHLLQALLELDYHPLNRILNALKKG